MNKILDWAEEDRPREKLERLGPSVLSDAELLAILIGSGNDEETAVGLMHRILADCNNSLNALGKMSIAQLCSYKGIGTAKADAILAACEIGKRRHRETPEERPRIATADAVYELLIDDVRDLSTEEAWIVLLNNRYRLIRKMRISTGGLSETAVDVRVIIREALLHNAAIIVLAHNHPSGGVRPSRQDDSITEALNKACSTMRILLADHVILTDGAYYSYHDENKL